jgi:hypothetical protein
MEIKMNNPSPSRDDKNFSVKVNGLNFPKEDPTGLFFLLVWISDERRCHFRWGISWGSHAIFSEF